MELPEAMRKLGELETTVANQNRELETLRTHKTSLEADLVKHKKRATDAEAKVSDLEKGQVNTDELERYRALGTPEELDEIKKSAPQTKAELDKLKRKALVAKIAQQNQWDPDVLEEQLGDREIKIIGEGDSVAYQLDLGGKAKTVQAFITEDRKKYLPALKLDSKRAVYTGPGNGGSEPEGAATKYIKERKEAQNGRA